MYRAWRNFGVMKETHDLAVKVGRPTARQIDNKKNKYMASDCPLAGKHLNQLSKDTEINLMRRYPYRNNGKGI